MPESNCPLVPPSTEQFEHRMSSPFTSPSAVSQASHHRILPTFDNFSSSMTEFSKRPTSLHSEHSRLQRIALLTSASASAQASDIDVLTTFNISSSTMIEPSIALTQQDVEHSSVQTTPTESPSLPSELWLKILAEAFSRPQIVLKAPLPNSTYHSVEPLPVALLQTNSFFHTEGVRALYSTRVVFGAYFDPRIATKWIDTIGEEARRCIEDVDLGEWKFEGLQTRTFCSVSPAFWRDLFGRLEGMDIRKLRVSDACIWWFLARSLLQRFNYDGAAVFSHLLDSMSTGIAREVHLEGAEENGLVSAHGLCAAYGWGPHTGQWTRMAGLKIELVEGTTAGSGTLVMKNEN